MYTCTAKNIMSRMFTLRNIVRIISIQNLSFLIFIRSILKKLTTTNMNMFITIRTLIHIIKTFRMNIIIAENLAKAMKKSRTMAIAINKVIVPYFDRS